MDTGWKSRGEEGTVDLRICFKKKGPKGRTFLIRLCLPIIPHLKYICDPQKVHWGNFLLHYLFYSRPLSPCQNRYVTYSINFVNLPFAKICYERYLQKIKVRGFFLLQIVTPPDFLPSDDWTPLIVIGNRKSGSKETSAILANFRAQLNPAQVRPFTFADFNLSLKKDCQINLLIPFEAFLIL
jgi:hypothetical protein